MYKSCLMDVQATKLDLIRLIMDVEDASTLSKLKDT